MGEPRDQDLDLNIDILTERRQLAAGDASWLEQVCDRSWLNKVRAEQHQPPVAAYAPL